ncbi:MAG: hypothetical protein A4E44_00749 [Methanosaeta sp. PtaB.Bin018]|jgi:hypothetical protein|nr:MAG: hypothetical protein A4E44_00749 [Methanosaeta sp. PtaB.Bin018]OPY48181.1 MAG: hypothetical protein A4E46_00053 [Methanosaeta sp. PtaU1.Bin016]
MSNTTFTDSAYQAIEQAEKRKKQLMYIILGCILTSLPGLGINAFIFMAGSNQKGSSIEDYLVLISVLVVICLIIMIVGIHKFILLRNLEHKLNQVELLEETIYNEVLKTGGASISLKGDSEAL